MNDWLLDHIGWVIGTVVAVALVGCYFAIRAEDAHEERFMLECQQDRKRYECEAMWRAGRNNTSYVPVVIPVGR